MAINFKEIAQKELSLSPLMTGRTQIHTDDIIGKTLTISAFDFASLADKDGTAKSFPVILFHEIPDGYYNGGQLLFKLCMAWADAFGGDIDAANAELADFGGVPVKFKATKTKAGNNLTSVEVL